MMQEKSGDYGAAIGGGEKTTVWASQGGLGGNPAGRDTPDGANKVALILSGVLIAALIVICFRLAFGNVKKAADSKRLTALAYRDSDPSAPTGANPGVPAGTTPRQTAPRLPLPVNLPAPASLSSSPVVAPIRNLFLTDAEREQVAGLLLDCRAAYEASGELSQRWVAIGAVQPATRDVGFAQTRVAEVDADSASASRFPTVRERDTINTQMDAIDTTVSLATQPARYPPSLQDTSIEVGTEMHIYLQTTRIALAQTDPAKRSAAQARADTHRRKAGQLLATLETAIKSGVLPHSAGD